MHKPAFWHNILRNNGAIPADESLRELTAELLDFMRSPDPLLRDEFGYQLLTHWIMNGQYDDKQLRDFMARWLHDWNSGLGESGSDTVITRSFAALMLSILIYRDMQASFLTNDEIATLVDDALETFADEADWRGYDKEKGWLHALAHMADVFKFLARNRKSTPQQHMRILDGIAQKLTQKTTNRLTHSEDERLALAVIEILKRQTLSEPQLRSWANDLIAVKELSAEDAPFEADVYGAYQNTKHFLRALYFRITYAGDLPGAYNLEEDLFLTLHQFVD